MCKRFKKLDKANITLLWLAAALALLFIVSLALGRYHVPIGQLLRILAAKLFPFFNITATWTGAMWAAVVGVRLPRIILSCMVGCCLSTAGAAYQSIFRNPMASPDILGATSGAGFGAALAILLGMSAQLVTVFAFLGGLCAVGLAFAIAKRARGGGVIGMILTGIVIGSLFTAGTSYIKIVADPANQLPAITYWLMGSMAGVGMSDALFAAIPMLLGLVPLFLLRFRLNLLSLSDAEVRTLGVHPNGLRAVTVVCATLITAASVSISGVIGWVGLVVPHIGRMLVGSGNKKLLPAAMLLGALFMLTADNIARCLAVSEIPIGIVTAIIGAPLFLIVLIKKGSVYE